MNCILCGEPVAAGALTDIADLEVVRQLLSAKDAEIAALRNRWRSLAHMINPWSNDDCMCVDRPSEDHEDESRRDIDNPSCHSQYCPVYVLAYVEAIAEGSETPP